MLWALGRESVATRGGLQHVDGGKIGCCHGSHGEKACRLSMLTDVAVAKHHQQTGAEAAATTTRGKNKYQEIVRSNYDLVLQPQTCQRNIPWGLRIEDLSWLFRRQNILKIDWPLPLIHGSRRHDEIIHDDLMHIVIC